MTLDEAEAERLRRSHADYLIVEADWKARHTPPLPDPVAEEFRRRWALRVGRPTYPAGPLTWSPWPRRPPSRTPTWLKQVRRVAECVGVGMWAAVLLTTLLAMLDHPGQPSGEVLAMTVLIVTVVGLVQRANEPLG